MSQIRWTLNECLAEAKKYTSTKQWLEAHSPSFVAAAHRMGDGWFEQCTKHMTPSFIRSNNPPEVCIHSASKHKTIESWRDADQSAYKAASKLRILRLCTMHMVSTSRIKWTFEYALMTTEGYTDFNAWRSDHKSGFERGRDNGWIKDLEKHFNGEEVDIIKYTRSEREICIHSAQKHPNRTVWSLLSPREHMTAIKNGWISECTEHMTEKRLVL